ncbi:MAG: DNA mismatch repair endonuclease MutL, partial [Clostridia bacterium]|nr:DNA mismatch repair endonuclease MutL [Clostridia bacterium]
MTKINILDSSVYNQISAGEVVENPASIVKELIENSIDAGAQNISVYIEDGGIKSVQVVDDGEGMTKDDLSRSILPHATSKIRTAEDLYTVSTLGFRGEALASVAAVSAVDIRSKHFESPLAYGIEVKGGEITKSGVIALSKGTSITVSN